MRQLDFPKTISHITDFIKKTVTTAGFTDVVVAVSGGIDSAVSISLAVKALGGKHVHALLLPYKDWHDEHKLHAQKLLVYLQLPQKHIYEIDISPMVTSFQNPLQATSYKLPAQNVRLGNIMARTRMIVLYDYAKKLNALALGTENKSEHYLGYFTRFGDEASDIEPIRNLYKTEVYVVAKELGVPEEILTKAPTASLWPGQTDEGQLGFSYQEADEILWRLYDKHETIADFPAEIDRQTADKVKTWVEKVQFKHKLPHIAPEPIIRP